MLLYHLPPFYRPVPNWLKYLQKSNTLTTQGSYQYKPNKKGKEKEKEKKKENIKERQKRPSTLNLDGGMSVDMGIILCPSNHL